MKHAVLPIAGVLLLPWLMLAQQSQPAQPSPAARTDIYHVHFVKAAPGKSRELLESLKTPAPNAPMPGHMLVLQHREGDDWDFAAIEHLGTKATVEVGPPGPSPARELRAWHNDTYATGPAWADFAKAMGIAQPAAAPAAADKSIYILTTYRGAAGHRLQLEQTLTRIAAAAPKPGDSVLLQHAEGSPWDYLVITRYDSWQDLAAQQDDPQAEARQKRAGLTQPPGLELREHMASHHDTIADRVAIAASPAKPAR